MYSYTAATLAIRAKCSLSFHSLSLANDQPFCCHHPCCYFLVSPRILSGYLLGLSSPFASKALFHAGRRRFRIFYRSDESEMMGLLAKPEERFPGLGEPVWKKGRREIQIESIDGERRSSRKEGKAGICSSRRSDGFSSDRDSELNEVGRRRAGGESLVGFGNRKKGTRYDEAPVAEEELREVHKYVDDSWRERRHSSNRDVALDSRNKKSTMRNGSFRRLEVKDVEEKVDQRANLAHQVNIRESGLDRRSKKVTRISEVQLEDQLDDVRRTSVLANVKKIERGENSTSAASQNSVLVADYQPTGRLEKQSKISDFRYNDARSAAYSQGDFEETSIRGRGERAYSKQNSAQVSRDKRVYLDRRALEQDDSRRSTQRLNEDSLLDGSDFDRASLVDEKRVMGVDVIPNLVQDSSQLSRNNRPQIETELHFSVKNRYEGKEDKRTKAGNSIQLRGGERKQIVRGAVELDEAHRNTQRLSEVSEFGSGSKEAFSLSKENRGIEFKSYSVQSSVPATKDKGIQVEMQDAYYDYDRIEMSSANNFVNATSSWCSPVSRVDPQEYGALLASNQVSSIREQNDQANKQAYLLYGAKMESERDTSEFDLISSNNRRISSLQDTYNSRIENEKVFPSTKASSLALIQDQEIQRSSVTGESSQSESMDMTSIGGLHGISSPQPTFSDLNYNAGWIGSQKIQHNTNYSAGVFDKSSASHVGEFVGRLQKEAVALSEVGKIPNVIDGVQIGKQGRRDVQATIRIENRDETSSTVSTQERKERQSNLLVGESSQYKTLKIASTGSLGDVSSPVETYSETDNHSHRDDIRHITNNAIESAKRLDKSSAFLVDEFVDEMRQEILNESGKDSNVYTRFQIEETGRRESHKAAGMQAGELTESTGYGDGRDNKEGRRLSSSGLEMSGPSEEMWGFQVASSLETSNAEEPGENSPTSEAVDLTTPLETTIARRSPKSLWSYVADIIRMSWILQGNSHSKTSKSEKRTSSNESLSSDAWFSGPEPEEDVAGDEAQNTKKAGLLKESGLVKESVKLPLQESKKGDRITVIEPNSSISSGFMTSGLSDRTASSSVEAEHTQDSKSSQATLSSVAIVEQQLASKSDAALPSITDIGESRVRDRVRVLKPSSSFPAAVTRVGFSSSITQATGAEQMEAVQVWDGNNSSLEKFEQPPLASTVDSALPRITDIEEVDRPGNIPKMELDPFSEKLPEVGGTQEAGIKRRKFQRSKQVLSEQFDEWEEAFKRENEQKKADEFFMREAILEAKKGADAWEVPVGAVLVQNGRIIARGCNMVEELRDSTSHAEMICIREASNVLRTWRLAETTLYVTLEPCPMCAGAILQARIDTVVWGAPNRLLGADGSWVRLFPGGDGGSSSLNPPSQMVGPVHPFHPKIAIRRGVLEAECGDVMQQFFKLRRKKDKKPESSPPPSCLPISNRPTKFFSKLHNIFGMMFCL